MPAEMRNEQECVEIDNHHTGTSVWGECMEQECVEQECMVRRSMRTTAGRVDYFSQSEYANWTESEQRRLAAGRWSKITERWMSQSEAAKVFLLQYSDFWLHAV